MNNTSHYEAICVHCLCTQPAFHLGQKDLDTVYQSLGFIALSKVFTYQTSEEEVELTAEGQFFDRNVKPEREWWWQIWVLVNDFLEGWTPWLGSVKWTDCTEPAVLESVYKANVTGNERRWQVDRKDQTNCSVPQWKTVEEAQGESSPAMSARTVCEWKKQSWANISKNPTSRRIIMTFICWCYVPRVIGVAVPTPQTKTPTEKAPWCENTLSHVLPNRAWQKYPRCLILTYSFNN